MQYVWVVWNSRNVPDLPSFILLREGSLGMLTSPLKVVYVPWKKVKQLRYQQIFSRSDDLAFILILTHNSGLSLGLCDRVSGQDAQGSARPCSNLPEYSIQSSKFYSLCLPRGHVLSECLGGRGRQEWNGRAMSKSCFVLFFKHFQFKDTLYLENK